MLYGRGRRQGDASCDASGSRVDPRKGRAAVERPDRAIARGDGGHGSVDAEHRPDSACLRIHADHPRLLLARDPCRISVERERHRRPVRPRSGARLDRDGTRQAAAARRRRLCDEHASDHQRRNPPTHAEKVRRTADDRHARSTISMCARPFETPSEGNGSADVIRRARRRRRFGCEPRRSRRSAHRAE